MAKALFCKLRFKYTSVYSVYTTYIRNYTPKLAMANEYVYNYTFQNTVSTNYV